MSGAVHITMYYYTSFLRRWQEKANILKSLSLIFLGIADFFLVFSPPKRHNQL